MEELTRTRRVRFGVFEVDLRSGELHKQGFKIKLQDQPFQILAMLLEHPGEVVTREELRQKLWSTDTFVDFDVGLNVAIKKLRDALRDSADNPRFVETLPRRGYRFIAPVEDALPAQVRASSAGAAPPLKASAAASREPLDRMGAAHAERGEGKGIFRLFVVGALALVAAAALVFGLNLGGARQKIFGGASPPKIQSLAVLPLDNLTGDPAQEYFADGMTDALITDLAQIRALRVISRTSVMRYKGTRKPLPEIARELNVDAVLEGSVVRSANHVRIDAQLIRATTDQHLWAKSYQRELRDIVTMQSEVAREVANEIRIQLTPQERARLGSAKPVDPEAYEDYLKGRFYSHQWTSDSFGKAIGHFQQAIERDPNYAPAYAGLSDSYRFFSFQGPVSPRELMPKAEFAARKALELDEGLSDAHTSLAGIKLRVYWDWSGAEKEYQRAMALNPNDAENYRQYSVFLRTANRYQEAIAAAQRGIELDPVSSAQRTGLGSAYLIARQYDRAIEELQEVVATGREDALAHWFLGVAYEYAGRNGEASSELEKSAALSHRDPNYLASLGHAYAQFGRRADARKILSELEQRSRQRYIAPVSLAVVCVGLGEKKQALAWLGKAYEDRSFSLVAINSWPWWDPLRSEPEFRDLVRRIGLDPDKAIPRH